MAHEQFGPYLLLKKLGDNPLGETFRAGRVQDNSLEQVLLLQVLNGPAAKITELGTQIQSRAQVQKALKSPSLAHGVDLGELHGVPYVAYDYISGRNLASLMRQAAQRSHPVPTEHALLIAERLALGLSVAFGTRVNDEPVTHGFVTPETAMISNEGEIRVLGFEFSQILRRNAVTGTLLERYGRYLSPETRGAAAPTPADDVYSMGIILLELLGGRPVRDTRAEALAKSVQGVAGQGLPNIASLIERSLLPAAQRISDVTVWHSEFAQMLHEGHMSSTPFHLAFYMHNLFRDEIEAESAEIEREKTIDFSKEQLAAPPPPNLDEPTGSMPVIPQITPEESRPVAEEPTIALSLDDELLTGTPASAARDNTPPPLVPPREPSSQNLGGSARSEGTSNRLVAALLVGVAIVLASGATYFAWQSRSGSSVEDEAPAISAAAASPVDVDPPEANADPTVGDREAYVGDVPGGETSELDATETEAEPEQPAVDPEKLLRDIDRMVAQRTRSVEQNLKTQYDGEIQRLRDQLAEVEKEREAERLRAEQLAEEQRIAAEEEEQRKAEQAAAEALAEAEKTSDDDVTPAQEIGEIAASSVDDAPLSEAAEPEPTPAPTPERVRYGQLVERGPGVTPPRLRSQIDPVFPYAAKRLRKEADVELRVLVDENGEVIEVQSTNKAGFGFDEAATQAARRADYVPATKNGVRVKMWTGMRISFRN